MVNLGKKEAIIDLAIRQVEREGKLARKDWLSLVLDRMVIIRNALLASDSQSSRAKKRWNKNQGV